MIDRHHPELQVHVSSRGQQQRKGHEYNALLASLLRRYKRFGRAIYFRKHQSHEKVLHYPSRISPPYVSYRIHTVFHVKNWVVLVVALEDTGGVDDLYLSCDNGAVGGR